jgi:hypothetical protein
MILALLLSTYPMLAVFEGEVKAQAARLGIEAPRVLVVQPLPRPDRWAWVGQCDSLPCPGVIYVRRDVLTFLGYDSLRMCALHEVLHIWRGDNLDPRWVLTTPDALRYQEKVHEKIADEVVRHYDQGTRDAAARDIYRWRQRWAKR